MKFYDREQELKRITNEYEKLKHHSSAIVLAGRRRIGKTRLAIEAFKNNPDSASSADSRR
ncbi:MAG: ATP-binding protein [bacterium]|nr:ATP-binding protein [bacterium]